MELWNYIQILGIKKKGWLFKKDNSEERLTALSKILEFADPSSIQNLIPFLKDDNKEIQKTTCKVITELFNKIETKSDFNNTIKHCNISESDLDYYNQNFSKQERLILFSISTLNGNGYVREKALQKLAETNSEQAIPFIVFRLADWVPAVRQTALKSLENFKKKEYINALIENLVIFEGLQKVERTDLSSVHSDIMNFVVIQNKQFVIDNFKTFTDKTRIVIAKQISYSTNIELDDLKALLNDKHFLVRNFALTHFEKLTQIETDNLLKDKSARVRLQTLYNLKSRENFSKIVFPFLADNSASIRDFARYTLKNSISDYPKIYNDNLKNNLNVIGSLFGLAETKGMDFAESVLPFLKDDKLKVRKTAFIAIKQLDNNKAHEFAIQNLDSEYVGIRNIIIEYFANTTSTDVLQKARVTYTNGHFELKKSMLKLFSKVGKWTTIADLMIGTIDEDENIRQLSFVYLQHWRKKATTYFIQPKQEELERANQIFKFAFEIHKVKKYFDKNPLTGLDFYLQ